MCDHNVDARLESLRKQIEEKRAELNHKALEFYDTTGKLSDPLLCEIAHEFYELAREYSDLERTIKENE